MDDQRLPRSIGKALLVFSALRDTGAPMRLTDVSVSTGIAKSTTYHMLHALTSANEGGHLADH